MKQNSIDKKYIQFNDYLRGEMRRRKISQSQAATWLNLPQTSISQRLNGNTEWTMREIMSLYELMEIEHDFTEQKRSSVYQNRTSNSEGCFHRM